MELELEGRCGYADPSRAAIVRAGVDHTFSTPADTVCLVADLPTSLAEQLAGSALSQASEEPFVPIGPATRHLVHYAQAKLRRSAPPSAVAAQLNGLLLLELLDRSLDVGVPVAPQLRRALDHIEAGLHSELSVRTIALVAGCGVTHLRTLFRAAFDRSVMAYVAHRRVSVAAQMLAASATPVAEVALRVGYSDQTALTRAMRRILGTTPRACRGRVAAH